MSSMKSFKSKISIQKREPSRSRISNASNTQSINDVDLQNLLLNWKNSIDFKMMEQKDRIVSIPSELQITNNTGTRVFISVEASNESLFEIEPKRYILESRDAYIVTVKFSELAHALLDSFESQNFRVLWGKISSEEITSKSMPSITHSRVLGCRISNRLEADEMIVKLTFKSQQQLRVQNRESLQSNVYANYPSHNHVENAPNNSLADSDLAAYRDQNIRSKFIEHSDMYAHQERPSLLNKNTVAIVALVSFFVGFISV